MKIWTGPEVREELAEAFRVLYAMPLSDDHKQGFSSFWPKILHEADEVEEMRRQAVHEGIKLRVQLTPRKISRMEAVLFGDKNGTSWLKRFLDDQPALQRVLTASVRWEVAGKQAKIGCQGRGWAYSTFRRKRDQAAALLAERLTEAGIDLPPLSAPRPAGSVKPSLHAA